MDWKSVASTVLAVASLTTARVAEGQLVTTGNKPFSFGAAAGAAIPVGDLSNATNTGYNATLILGLNTPSLPMNFRLEGAYNNFGLKHGSGDIHNTSISGNAVFTFPTESAVRPYLIGGVGLYGTGGTKSGSNPFGSNSSNDFGFNVGGGITIPLSGFNAFAEARYHRVATSVNSEQFIPVVFGVMF